MRVSTLLSTSAGMLCVLGQLAPPPPQMRPDPRYWHNVNGDGNGIMPPMPPMPPFDLYAPPFMPPPTNYGQYGNEQAGAFIATPTPTTTSSDIATTTVSSSVAATLPIPSPSLTTSSIASTPSIPVTTTSSGSIVSAPTEKATITATSTSKKNKKEKKTTTSPGQTAKTSTPTPTPTPVATPDTNALSGNNKAEIARYIQQQPTKANLVPGEVFGLVTLSDNSDVDKETVVIYGDGTLGIKEPTAPGYLFEALLLEDYGLLIAPEPLMTVKLNDQNVFFLNDSLFNPSPIFSAEGWDLSTSGGKTVVCPSWNSVLTFVPEAADAPCNDAVDVNLRIVPIAGES